MRREESHQLEAAGQDSFLDVTTNIVGILIILVMIAGMRSKTTSAQAKVEQAAKEQVELLGRQATAVEYDVLRMQEQLDALEASAANQSVERQMLSTVMVAAEKSLAERRSRLDAVKQEEFDLQRQLDESKRKLVDAQQELSNLEASKPPTQQINHYSTPISRTISGACVYFQLKDKQVTYIPFDEFMEDIRVEMRRSPQIARTLVEQGGIVGPRNGFELQYFLDITKDRAGNVAGAGLGGFQVVPVGLQQSETIDEALREGSIFRRLLAKHAAAKTTVDLTTYPDSFAEYRRLSDELHRLGYSVSGMPTPEGVPIHGINRRRGTRPTAQ